MNRKRGFSLKEVIVVILCLGGLAILFLITVPGVQESAKRASCKGNLRQIGIALHLYADDHKGQFPSLDPVPEARDDDPTCTVQSFALLYPKYTDNVRIFSCASRPAHNHGADYARGGTLQTDSTSYAYDSRHSSNHAGPVIVAGDCQDGAKVVSANHRRGGGNYLAIDSSVMWVRAVRGATKLCVDPHFDDDIWTRTNGYVHDSCLRRTME